MSEIRASPGFNPRPREGGDADILDTELAREGFNPRPREGGDPFWYNSTNLSFVSIHAPVKGATLERQGYITGTAVSIHAPVKGATRFGAD